MPGLGHILLKASLQRAHAVWCLSSKNKLECVVTEIKSYQHFNCLTFPFLAGTKLHVHGVNCSYLKIFSPNFSFLAKTQHKTFCRGPVSAALKTKNVIINTTCIYF